MSIKHKDSHHKPGHDFLRTIAILITMYGIYTLHGLFST
jgi:hypothetical protein